MKPIDGDKLMMHLTDWWYSSFGQSETDESKAIKTVMDKIEQTLGEFALEKQEADRWIPVTERLPEEREWIGTKHFGTTISDEVYVTFEAPSGERFARHMMFQNGRLSRHDQRVMDTVFKGAKPIAWRPQPEPYKGDL